MNDFYSKRRGLRERERERKRERDRDREKEGRGERESILYMYFLSNSGADVCQTIFHSIQCILRTIKIYLILFGLFDLMGSRLSDLISTAADRLTKHSSSTRDKRAR